ncbi:MAG: Ig-like domain-containing protein [Gemmatimonadaceae bacterium]|jgi:hypothetical protein|nr:Ig-like domain-containing protein [Gemmatimonadaceae bacterium]
MTRRRLALVLAAMAGGCAQPMPPPGGPPDAKVPQLMKVEPESGAVNVRPRAVVLSFDEVIAERSGGSGGLAASVVVSPVSGETMVAWSRDQLYVRPSGGFRPNAVYTVTLLPGIADLRNNVMKAGRTIVFATGPSIPDTRLAGRAFDWAKGVPITKGFVEAIARTDSTVYLAVTDSTGAFELRHLPPGDYLVKGVLDNNGNRRLEPREPWDQRPVALVDSQRVELLAFVHDTIGPRIQSLAVQDSLTIKLTFDQPLLQEQALGPALFRVATADSQPVPIAAVLTVAQADSLAKLAAERKADSLARADTSKATPPDAAPRSRPVADSTKAPPPKPSRPSPVSDVVLKLEAPLAPATRYTVAAVKVAGLLGAFRENQRAFLTAVKRDTTAAADSSRRAPAARRRPPADTTRRPPP